MGRTKSTAERCRAQKTAKGMAKNKLLKATILSRPRARAISFLADQRAIRKITMPALHIESGARDNAKNVARRDVCICMPCRSRALSGRVSGFSKAPNCTTGRREDSRLLTTGAFQAHNFCESQFAG